MRPFGIILRWSCPRIPLAVTLPVTAVSTGLVVRPSAVGEGTRGPRDDGVVGQTITPLVAGILPRTVHAQAELDTTRIVARARLAGPASGCTSQQAGRPRGPMAANEQGNSDGGRV